MAEIVQAAPEFEIPAELHGFSVSIEVGPYPFGQRRSHRRAVYAVLRPNNSATAAKMARGGWGYRGAIYGQAAVDDETARALQLPIGDPGRLESSEQERLALEALKPAAKLAKMVAEAPE